MQNYLFNVYKIMIKNILVFILIFFVGNICKADTIDYWHVYYNKKKLKEFNQVNPKVTLEFQISNIKNGDSITIKYFRDTGCSECFTTLTVEDEKHIVTSNHGKGTFNPLSISLTDILRYKEQSSKNYFEIYYYENEERTNGMLLFRVKLE
ncbi:MAG: hypothetical protein QM802_22370 [Agriterribacter sp.]